MAVFLGDEPFARVQQLEAQRFVSQFVERDLPVIPVILPETKGDPKVPEFLSLFHLVDFRKTDPDPLEQLIWGITGDRASQAMR